jgi:hypothetical protein
MGSPKQNLEGQKFGRLLVKSRAESSVDSKSRWNCVCDCGVEKVVAQAAIKGGQQSCGCLKLEARLIDMVGKKFGKLTVLKKSHRSENKKIYYECACDCGKTNTVVGVHLRAGRIRSCGCLLAENKSRVTHGLSNSYEYSVWLNIKQRCGNQNNPAYKYYGGRGIDVCESWFNSYEVFVADMGNAPSKKHSIDRIDNNSGYNKENCRWVEISVQSRNKRNNKMIIVDGMSMCQSDWADCLGKSSAAFREMIQKRGDVSAVQYYLSKLF